MKIKTILGLSILLTGCVNLIPVADDQSVSTQVDLPVAITVTGSDDDGDTLSFSVITSPANGVLSGTAPNLTYTPNGSYSGADSFNFTANDGQGGIATGTVSIDVGAAPGAPTAPTAGDQALSTPEDTALAIVLTGSDPESDPLTFLATSSPANGTLSGTAPNLTFTPNADFNGSDSFTFTANDSINGGIDTGTISITINPVNDDEVANDQNVVTNENVAVAITLTGSDVDLDALTFAVASNPSNGALSGTAPNLTYTPTTDFDGSDSFTFTADDSNGSAATGTVSITVNNVVTSRPDITVMGYNIQMLPFIAGDWDQNQRADHLEAGLATMATTPDVIGYSEVLTDYSYTKITGMTDYPYATPVVGELCAGGGWDSIYGPCSNAVGIVRGGMMVSSKYPIEEQHALIFQSTTSGSADAFANKGAAYIKIDISGYKYHIIGTHLQATHDGADDDEHLVRTDQMAEIREWLDTFNIPPTEPVIMAGDYNVPFSHTDQIDDMLVATKGQLNFPNNDGFGSYTKDNLMAKAFIFYFEDDVCYDDTLDYVVHFNKYLQPDSTPELDVIALKSPTPFYWSYLDGTWTDCGGGTSILDGLTTDLSDHYPVVATYTYPDGPDTAPGPDTSTPVPLKKSDSISVVSLLSAWDYFNYLRDAEDFPFDYAATEYSWINAAWLAEAAMLAYLDETTAAAEMADAGLPNYTQYDNVDTQCFVASNDDFAIMSCRGSEPTTLNDWLTDFDYTQVAAADGNGQVHGGFKAALDDVWTPMAAQLATLKAEGKTIWFTGHSLGGALATVAADRFCVSALSCDLGGVYSFAAPGVGDGDYAADFHAPHYRSVYYHDPVSRLPMSLLPLSDFEHTPSEVFYYDYEGNYTGFQTYPTIVSPAVAYHAPYYYSVYTWNGYVRSVTPSSHVYGAPATVDTSASGVTIDNSSAAFAESGTWEAATAGVFEGADYRLSIDAATPAQASWSFTVATAGDFDVLFKAPGAFGFSDTYYGSDKASFTLYQGSTELGSFTADLYNTAYDFTSIGNFNLVLGETYHVVLKGAHIGESEYAIAADAIKVVSTAGHTFGTPVIVDTSVSGIIIDNSAAAYAESGTWEVGTNHAGQFEGADYRVSNDTATPAQASWSFQVATAGDFQVSFKTPGAFGFSDLYYGSDATTFKLYYGATELASVTADLYNNAYDFTSMGIFTWVPGQTYDVIVTGAYSTYAIAADSIKVTHQAACSAASLCVNPIAGDVTIDNDNSVANHYTETGSGWAAKTGSGVNSNYRYSTSSADEAQFTFNVETSGNYRIEFASPGGFSYSHGYGSDATVYKLKEGATVLATSANVDLYNSAYAFGDVDVVASVALTAGTDYTVTVSGTYSSYYTYGAAADAIKLVHLP